MSLTGTDADHPQRVGVPIGDLLAGMYGAYGVVAALHERNRTGVGRVVRTSLLAAHRRRARLPGHRATPSPVRSAARRRQPPPVDLRPTACSTAPTAMIQIACGSEGLWVRLAEASASTPRPRAWRPTASGSRNRDEVIDALNAAFADIPARRPARRGWPSCGIPAGEVRTLDRVYDWDQTR